MDFPNSSPTSSTSSTFTTTNHPNNLPHNSSISTATDNDPMHSWWESISKARSRIHCLASLLPSSLSPTLSSLADSDRPALSLLSSSAAYDAVSLSLSSSALSGSGSDPLCHWLYDTFLSSDPHLRLVVFSFLPLLSGLYLSRIHSLSSDSASLPSLAGFEAVLLALYSAETKARNGKPLVVSIPDLSQPSLYHIPRHNKPNPSTQSTPRPSIGVLSPSLEPQVAVKSTKRACIVGVALDSYYKHISQMPTWSKIDFCRFLASWAGQDCSCQQQFGDNNEPEITGFLENGNEIDFVAEEMSEMRIEKYGGNGSNGVDLESKMRIEKYGGSGSNGVDLESKGSRIPLPWELLQPALRILGHCLLAPLNSQDVKDAASVAVRRLYARASHDLVPQVILATQSLIQLDNRGREAAKAAAAANPSSNANTPSKAKKPEILLVSK